MDEDQATDVAGLDASGGSTLGERLAAEIRQGAIPREDLEVLRGQLGLDLRTYGDPAGGVEARLRHLQSEVSTLAAYTEEMEDLLDAEGTARQFVEGASEDIDALESRLDALDSRTTRRGDRLDDVDDATDRHERRLDDLDATTDDHAERLDALETELDDLRETVVEFDARLDALEESVEDIQGWREEIEGVFR